MMMQKRYERRRRKGGEYLYDNKKDCVLSLIDACKLLNKYNGKISVVYNMQRWDEVRLIKGFEDKEEAEKLRRSLGMRERSYDEVYCTEEIEVEELGHVKKE